MKKNMAIIFVVIAVIVAGLWFWASSEQEKNAPQTAVTSDIIFFYGQECPHCKDVEKFLADNDVASKVKFDSLEVWHNTANSNLLLQKAEECGISKDKAGVPFLYAKGKCYVGTPDVENFFKQEAGIQ